LRAQHRGAARRQSPQGLPGPDPRRFRDARTTGGGRPRRTLRRGYLERLPHPARRARAPLARRAGARGGDGRGPRASLQGDPAPIQPSNARSVLVGHAGRLGRASDAARGGGPLRHRGDGERGDPPGAALAPAAAGHGRRVPRAPDLGPARPPVRALDAGHHRRPRRHEPARARGREPRRRARRAERSRRHLALPAGLGGRPSNHGGCGERSGGCERRARSSLLRRAFRHASSVVAALAALAPRLVRLAHPDYSDGLLAMAIRITRVYTRRGDQGETDLVGGSRVAKDSPRIDAYGTVDELNAAVGVARAVNAAEHRRSRAGRELDAILRKLQSELFDLGGELATPAAEFRPGMFRVGAAEVKALETLMDRCQKDLAPLKSFVLAPPSCGVPSGTPRRSSLRLPLSLPGSFASLTMITPTDS